MPIGPTPRRRRGVAALLAASAALALGAPAADGVAPTLGPSWASDVSATSARLHCTITPNGLASSYRFDYITTAAYEANLAAAKDGFSGAARAPVGSDDNLASPFFPAAVTQLLGGLSPDTAYRYRIVAQNVDGAEEGPTLSFHTQSNAGGLLPDGRGWEMVSPVDKNGGRVDPPGTLAFGGVLQGAPNGAAITYSSAASFGPGAQGAAPPSQYIASRSAGGWSTENITAPLFSGSYANPPDGGPYQLFSEDLASGLLLNGRHCRGEGTDCAVANPPPPGSGALVGYQNYYLRETATASFAALLSANDLTGLDPAAFEVAFAGATPDLDQIVLSSCAALTADAGKAVLGEGCDPDKPNLYRWTAPTGLSLVNVTPGAALAAPSGAISADGSRVYWRDLTTGDLYLREGAQTKLVDGGGGTFQTASIDGATAFYAKAGHLYRYNAVSDSSTDLTPAGEVQGVLGASEDGSYLYYLTNSGLFLRHGATTTKVAAAADEANYPPATGAARVSPEGTHLVFVSTTSLNGYDNADATSGAPDSEVYLYDDLASALTCVSCNPTEARPIGPSTIPGATPNGKGADAPRFYKPRVLGDQGRRVFFDSEDSLVPADTNGGPDAYQWEAPGVGSCTRPGGCLGLISSGTDKAGAFFADASAGGADAFFLTDASLVGSDPGAIDLYDARIGGGFPEARPPIPCEGDACQSLPSEPVDPALNTLLAGLGNPPVRYLHHQGLRRRGHGKHHKKHKHKGKVKAGGRR